MSNPIEEQFQQIDTELKCLNVIENAYGELLNIPNFRNEVRAFYDSVAKQMRSWLNETRTALIEEGLDRLNKATTEVAVINATKSTFIKNVSVEIPFRFKRDNVYVDINKIETLNDVYGKINGDPLPTIEQIFAVIGINCRQTENGLELNTFFTK